jgi:predicted PurR-regulated permease PerM
MELLSPVHLFLILAIGIVVFWPIVRILQRAGFSPWWCVFMLIPFANFIAPWVFAYAKWPALEGKEFRDQGPKELV